MTGMLHKGIVWADVSDADDDDDDNFFNEDEIRQRDVLRVKHHTKLDDDMTAVEVSSSSEEYFSESEAMSSDASADETYGRKIIVESKAADCEDDHQRKLLSKREQKKLDMQDLGAALAEFGINVEVPTSPPLTTPDLQSNGLSNPLAKESLSKSAKKKRKPKKTILINKFDALVSADGNPNMPLETKQQLLVTSSDQQPESSSVTVAPEDALNRLKRLKSKSKKSTDNAQATALAEAKKRVKPKLKKSEKIPQYQK